MQVCERSREGAREGKSTVLQSQRREKLLPEICHNKERPPSVIKPEPPPIASL